MPERHSLHGSGIEMRIQEVAVARTYPQITIYSRPWCGSVLRVKRWLDQREIPYTEIDITKNGEAARYVEQLNNGYQSVPTILFDGVYVATEPSSEEMERLLG
jgi:mycoredoxin